MQQPVAQMRGRDGLRLGHACFLGSALTIQSYRGNRVAGQPKAGQSHASPSLREPVVPGCLDRYSNREGLAPHQPLELPEGVQSEYVPLIPEPGPNNHHLAE